MAVLRALGNAEAAVGDPAGIEHLRSARETSVDVRERLAIALDIAQAGMGRFFDEILAELPAAIAEGQDDDPETAMLAHGLLLGSGMIIGHPRWTATLEAAHALHDHGHHGLGRRVLAAFLAFAGLMTNAPADRIRQLGLEAVADDREYEESLAAGWQLTIALIALGATGDWALSERRHEQALANARARGSAVVVRNVLWTRLAVRTLRGDLAAAESDGRQVLELLADRAWGPAVHFAGDLLEVLLDRSDPTVAEQLLTHFDLTSGSSPAGARPRVLCARSRLRLIQGRPDAALADIETARTLVCATHVNPVPMASVEEHAAMVLRILGRDEEATAAAQSAVALARSHGGPGPLGTAIRAEALVIAGPDQIERLAEAVDLLDASGRRVEHARALIELGAAHRRRGERKASRPPLARGRELAHTCGANRLADRATQELLATGARPRRVLLSGTESLTASERRVAEMAATGMTTRTLAEQLFVTQKTVETHLTRIYRKLNINRRSDLADALSDARRRD
jgi:DNA-binding CsgD family transcriptional regulator